MTKTNITLIGMSGVGKSAVGNILAKSMGWRFIDTDQLMEAEQGKPLQDILDEIGEERFKKMESSKVRELFRARHAVFAPGGSIVYSRDAMELLKNISTIVYLSSDPQKIEGRIDTASRGIVGLKEKSFKELYAERESLYKKFADLVVDTSEKTPHETAEEILSYGTNPLSLVK